MPIESGALPFALVLTPARSLAGLAITYHARSARASGAIMRVRVNGVICARVPIAEGTHTAVCSAFVGTRSRAVVEIDADGGRDETTLTDLIEIPAYVSSGERAEIDRSSQVEVFVERLEATEDRSAFAVTLDATAAERYVRSTVSAKIASVARDGYPHVAQVYVDDAFVCTASLMAPFAQSEFRLELEHDRTYRLTFVSRARVELKRTDVLARADRANSGRAPYSA